ncbi:hypothetical protein C0J50_9574 [Silurus asotus]|uniref:Ig-like domain-containing protein n=1 Tax=Silurus asotus TaxID=30991 RepID=A0AAD5A1P5_SILAS|nr:hypothetical protein C0J50_9574 [Silurus asotus]
MAKISYLQGEDMFEFGAGGHDSDLYYCALVPTVTGNPAALYTNLYTGELHSVATAGSFADKIGQTDEDANIRRKETETVTLKCSYELNSGYIWLYWYKQYPHSAPQFLLYKGVKSASGDDYNPSGSRFSAETTSGVTKLIIIDLQISDSALYHCALGVGAAQ